MESYDVTIVGGCGRVGLPLGLAFAARGLRVALYDVSADAVDTVNAGQMPFVEPGAPDVLAAARAAGRLEATLDRDAVARRRARRRRDRHPDRRAPQPRPRCGARGDRGDRRLLADGQLLVLRSTVYPGVTAVVERLVAGLGLDVDVAFCPERIAEGKAMVELSELPQIVAGRTRAGARSAPPSSSATSPTRSCTSSPRRPSSPSCSRTPGGTSSSRPPTSCS